MSDDSKVTLSWIDLKSGRGAEPCLTFEIVEEAQAAKSIYGSLLRVCPDPRCGCLTISVHYARLLPDDTVTPNARRALWLDLDKRSVFRVPELENDPEALRLSDAASESISSEAWEQLRVWFWAAKTKIIEQAEISEIDLTDLPDATGGLMVPLVEVFPCGLSLNFSLENAHWAADEAYCVQPGCECTSVVLGFLQLQDAAGRRPVSLKNVPTIRYDHRKRTSREESPGTPGSPKTAQLLAALQSAHPSLDSILQNHQRMMQALYQRQFSEQSQLRQARTPTHIAVKEPKTGRNDPCPCGSGKKFKKCCGA